MNILQRASTHIITPAAGAGVSCSLSGHLCAHAGHELHFQCK